jgi:glycine/D-amino acid oxidase-like deaminating enzyme
MAGTSLRAIIVGGGIMGLCTAWALARSGHSVELFEQAALPNPLGSSMDQHRLIRHPYGAQAGYARMVDEAFAAWDALWRDLGQSFFAPTGTLCLSAAGNDWSERSAATLAAIGNPMAPLDPGELARRFPMIDARGAERAYWMATGGTLFAQDIVEALVHHLASSPAVRLHPHTPVREVDLERGRVTTASGATHSADVVIVAAGAWVGRLLPARAAELVPSRQVVVYFDLPDPAREAWARGPLVLDLSGAVGLYVVPPMQGRGMKVGDHEFSRVGDPDSPRDATPGEVRPLLDRCRVLLKGAAEWRIDQLKVCYYTVTRDERFVVEKPGSKGWIMSPCSGHGFKFGAVMGMELARTIASGRAPLQHARWAAGLEEGE